MKASKFTEAQKAFILKQGEGGTPVDTVDQAVGRLERQVADGGWQLCPRSP